MCQKVLNYTQVFTERCSQGTFIRAVFLSGVQHARHLPCKVSWFKQGIPCIPQFVVMVTIREPWKFPGDLPRQPVQPIIVYELHVGNATDAG